MSTHEELEAADRAIRGEVQELRETVERHEMELDEHARWRVEMDKTVASIAATLRQVATKADVNQLRLEADTTPTKAVVWFVGCLCALALASIVALAWK